MKLSKETIKIFKHFASLNPGIHILPGKTIISRVGSTNSTSVLAKADIEEEFPVEICINNLVDFIKMVDFSKDYDMDFNFEETHVEFTSKTGGIFFRYMFSPNDLLPVPKNFKYTPESVRLNFNMSADDFKKIRGLMQVGSNFNDIFIKNKDGNIVVEVSDGNNRDGNNAYIILGPLAEDQKDMEFSLHFKKTDLNLPSEYDYEVDVAKMGKSIAGIFKAIEPDVPSYTQFVGVQSDSVLE